MILPYPYNNHVLFKIPILRFLSIPEDNTRDREHSLELSSHILIFV